MEPNKYSTAPSPLSSFLLGAVICSAILLATLPGGNLINIGISVVFVASVMFNAIAGKRALWFSPELLILVAWLCYSMLGTLNATDVETAMFKSLTMVQILLLAFCVQQVVVWNQANPTNLVVYGIAVSISYILTFTGISAQEVAGAEDVAGDVNRVASTLNDENTFGAVALMAFSFGLIALAKSRAKAATLPLALLLILLFVAVVNSGSRTALLGGVLLLLGSAWAFRLWRGSVLGKFLFSGTAALVLGGAVLLAAKSIPEVEDRIEAVFSSDSAILSRVEGFFSVIVSGDTRAESGNSIDERVSMISDGLQVVSDHPIIGVGLDNFRVVTGAGTYAHSNLIEVAASTGLVGLVLFHLMYLVLTVRALKLIGRPGVNGTIARLALVGLMTYFLMDITRVSYYEKTSWIYFAILSGIVKVAASECFEVGRISSKRVKKRRRRRQRSSKQELSDQGTEFEDIDELFAKGAQSER